MIVPVDPFAGQPDVPGFTVESTSFSNGEALPAKYTSGKMGMPGGMDISPELLWSGAPDDTKSFAVTCFDADAPTGSGWWHWAVMDIPATVTELPERAGEESGNRLPEGAMQLRNDGGTLGYIGPAPPAGHGVHHYYFTVYALDVAQAGVDPDTAPAALLTAMSDHMLGRGFIVGTAEVG